MEPFISQRCALPSSGILFYFSFSNKKAIGSVHTCDFLHIFEVLAIILREIFQLDPTTIFPRKTMKNR